MIPPLLTCPAIVARHGFFTRAGGVSSNGYASLNGSLSGGDARTAVLANRGRVAAALALAPDRLLGLTQVHGATVVRVSDPWPPGLGGAGDAMVTARPDIGLCIITADCAPVLFADAAAGVIGAAHAGWRGALAGVLDATVNAMTDLGARHVIACIGPCIGRASYEVGSDLRDPVLAADPAAAACFTPAGGDRFRFDLPGYCAWRLDRAGVVAHRIDRDTYAECDHFFSHRRRTHAGGGVIGHQMSAIRL